MTGITSSIMTGMATIMMPINPRKGSSPERAETR